MGKFANHIQRWGDCKGCRLCKTRKNVVLARGKIPCDVLFIGEAPGQSEDVLGRPFIGPAGKLLDQIVADAIAMAGRDDVRMAFTNVIACIPIEDGDKLIEPPKYAIEACEERLEEFIEMAEPRAVVYVGKVAAKRHTAGSLGSLYNKGVETVEVVHPAAILRADIAQQSLMVQRSIVDISDLIETIDA